MQVATSESHWGWKWTAIETSEEADEKTTEKERVGSLGVEVMMDRKLSDGATSEASRGRGMG